MKQLEALLVPDPSLAVPEDGAPMSVVGVAVLDHEARALVLGVPLEDRTPERAVGCSLHAFEERLAPLRVLLAGDQRPSSFAGIGSSTTSYVAPSAVPRQVRDFAAASTAP